MASSTCLSDLNDDLLRRILSFLPAVDGAATAVLARRWRTLWHSSGAMNLDWRCDDSDTDSGKARRDFVRRAESALAAVHGESTVRRFMLHIMAGRNLQTHSFCHAEEGYLILTMLSNPAVRRVEELSIKVHISGDGYTGGIGEIGGIYKLSNGALPSETLRSLHITNCRDLGLGAPGVITFPWLASLRLQGCTILLSHLKGMIDTAPQLATLHLERSFLEAGKELSGRTVDSGTWTTSAERYRLRCPAVTDLVLANCIWTGWVVQGGGGIELDVPRLRYYRYVGFIGLVSLKSGAANLTRADLHFIDGLFFGATDKMGIKMCVSFWQFLQNFIGTKVLKVKLDYPIEHIAVVEENDLDELLGYQLFCNLECLEVEAWHVPSDNATAVVTANFFHCFPVVRHLMLKTTSSRMPAIPFDEDDAEQFEVSDIPELSNCSFNCLQSSLRRVRLQFQLEYANCFQVQLAKFLAENALVLEEMHFEDPNYKVRDYMNRRVRRWISDSSERRNSPTVQVHQPLHYARDGSMQNAED